MAFRRYLTANAVALTPSFAALLALHWSGELPWRPTLIAMAAIGIVFFDQRLSPVQIGCIALVLVGAIGLRASTPG